ncbi:MAG: HAD hydrolase family protein [Planctomycetota bacterium]
MRHDTRPDLLAIDIDGTLLDPAGAIPRENIEAIGRAQDAGVRVVLATGRGLIECRHVLRELDFPADRPAPVVVAGGAIVSDAHAGRTLHRFAMPSPVVADGVRAVNDHGHAALVLKDPDAAGYDYLVVTGPDDHPIDQVTQWWFNELKVATRFCRTLDDDHHPEQTVRVGACTRAREGEELVDTLRRRLGDHATLMTFSALVAPDRVRLDGERKPFTIVEAFSSHANKWSAIRWVCDHLGIDPARTAAIGDEGNDVDMVRGVGLGIAMGNAIDAVKQHAQRQTLPNSQAGVAHAIDRILAGDWSLDRSLDGSDG